MNISRIALAFALIVIAILALVAQTAARADDAPGRTMTLTGLGVVTTTPDKAVVTVGVVTDAKTAGQALAQNTQSMQAVMDLLGAQGVALKDIQTANFSVNPQSIYPNNDRNQPPRIVSYSVSNEVHATIRDLDKMGAILDKVVSAGSNRINGIRFTISNPEPVLDEARRLAVRDAIRKAGLFAKEAGVALGAITSITEVSASTPQPLHRRALSMAVAEAAVPIAAGQQSLQIQVTITWKIRD